MAKQFAILSAHSELYSDAGNEIATKRLVTRLESLYFEWQYVSGKYKNIEEQSILIKFNNSTERELLIRIAREFNQESILIVDQDRNCRLEYIAIGKWTEIKSPEQYDSWTEINGKYYVALF